MTLALLAALTVKSSALLALALAAALSLSRASASLRHWVLAVATCCTLALPVFAVLLPSWDLPAAHDDAGGSLVPPTAVSVTADTEAVVVGARVPEARTAAAAAAPAPARRPAVPPLAALLVPVWLSGVVLGAAVLLAGLARLRWLASRAVPLTAGPWYECARELARLDPSFPGAQLLQSHRSSPLVTWGVRPRILVPSDAAGWDRSRIRAVLCHEAAHIRRGDWWLHLGAELLCIVHWFNPLAWAAAARLRLESERACDDAVLASGVAAPDYADHLVGIARSLARSRALVPAPAMARMSSLERRVRAMLDTRVSRRPITRVLRLAVLVVLVALTASIASFAAQSTFGSIAGTIRDQLGGTVPDAVVALSHVQSGVRHEIRSDARGRFELVGLVPGNYRLEVKRPGFSSAEDALQLAAGQALPRDVTLQVGTLQETISVVDGPAAPPPARRQRPLPTGDPTCAAEANSGSIHPPAKVRDARPIYPASMSAADTPGRVLLKAVIGTDGSIRELTTDEATNSDFEQAAHEAVRQWRFTQTTLNCVPIDVTMRVSVNFRPDGQSQPSADRLAAPPPPPLPPPPPAPPAPR